MESIFDLLILLFLLSPFLLRLFRRQQPKGPGDTPVLGPPGDEDWREDDWRAQDQRREQDPLEDALRQIREALGEPVEARRPEPRPEPRREEFREQVFREHSFPGSIQVPASPKPPPPPPPRQPKPAAPRVQSRKDSDPLEVAELRTAHPIAQKLRRQDAAREAFVTGEIFNKPVSMRRR
jgi:hypothetical protein